MGCGQNKTKTITKTKTASGVNAFISHRKHRIHRLLFIIPFTLVFNSQNLQVASPLLPSGGKHKRSVCASVYFCEFCVRQKNRENQRYPRHPYSKREHVTKTIHENSWTIHGNWCKHKLSEITRELSEIIFAFFAAFARDK